MSKPRKEIERPGVTACRSRNARQLAPTEVTDLYDCPKSIGRPRLPGAEPAVRDDSRTVALTFDVANDVTACAAPPLSPGELALVDWLIDRALASWSAA